MDPIALLVTLAALLGGLAAGWFFGGRGVAEARAERDRREAEFKAAAADLGRAQIALATLEAEKANFEARMEELRQFQSASRETMGAQFSEIAHGLLDRAQKAFLERAHEKFEAAGQTNEAKLKSLLQPVEATLKRYEESVTRVEGERKEAYGNLAGLMESMRVGQESVKSEAAKLVNALRSAPKARGRWGEQQLRNVLETCGLAEHTDFLMEVSIDVEGGRLRPDAIVRVPGGKSLVIDAKVSLNAYQDAHAALDEAERATHMTAHVVSMKTHINALGAKAYQQQFEEAPDYVIMFVPGEHFLSAALEHAPDLWDYAFDRRVLIATPTNLIAIARTVAAVWRQEKLAGEAREIALLGKQLHERLSVMGGHVSRLGKNLETAMGAYNAFVGSMESQVLTSARRFEALNIDTGGKSIEPLPLVEQAPRPLAKLAPGGEAVPGLEDAAE